MIEQIKQLRVEIDGLAQLCEGLNPVVIYEVGVVPSRHCGCCTEVGFTKRKGNPEGIKEAIKSLKLSKAWLGKVLESLGSENPYGSGYKTIEDIVPETDKAEIICGSIGVDPINNRSTARDAFTVGGKLVTENYGTHIEKVDWLRTEIKRLIDKLERPTMPIDISSIKGDFNVEKYLEDMNKYGVMFLEPCVQGNPGSLGKATQYLQEARGWLGFEMDRIRDESK